MKQKNTLVMALALFATLGMYGQVKKFNREVNSIAVKIQNTTVSEKEDLKIKVDSLNVLVEKKKLTEEEAQELKSKLALESSARLENTINNLNDSLYNTVQSHVQYSIKSGQFYEGVDGDQSGSAIVIGRKNYIQRGNRIVGDRRNRFQIQFAYGMSNLATEGAFANSDILYVSSNFIQWGFNINRRLLKESNLLHLRYGVLLEYNNLKPTEHRYFEKQADGQVAIVEHDKDLRKNRLAIRSVQIPVYLEFDFSKPKVNEKTGRTYFRSQETWRVGIGGFVNLNRKDTYQVYRYTDEGHEFRTKEKTDLDINKVRYGVGAYVGNGDWSLFAQYELTPMFKHNDIKQNMWSFGVRVDL
ncbi:hypothetical protein [Myroides odoratimimus]|uniref:hypothetical protein n=1 Tax=Myroides odoratimimus TaxID=76832 RepID=UPI001F066DCB|nr:hypothetical protein [Myroides odoratimimus]